MSEEIISALFGAPSNSISEQMKRDRETTENRDAADRRRWAVEQALIHFSGNEPGAVIAIAKRMVKYLETGK